MVVVEETEMAGRVAAAARADVKAAVAVLVDHPMAYLGDIWVRGGWLGRWRR